MGDQTARSGRCSGGGWTSPGSRSSGSRRPRSGPRLEGTILLAQDAAPLRVDYEIACTPEWRTRRGARRLRPSRQRAPPRARGRRRRPLAARRRGAAGARRLPRRRPEPDAGHQHPVAPPPRPGGGRLGRGDGGLGPVPGARRSSRSPRCTPAPRPASCATRAPPDSGPRWSSTTWTWWCATRRSGSGSPSPTAGRSGGSAPRDPSGVLVVHARGTSPGARRGAAVPRLDPMH